jgi:uncharacterized protein (DUF433 family)
MMNWPVSSNQAWTGAIFKLEGCSEASAAPVHARTRIPWFAFMAGLRLGKLRTPGSALLVCPHPHRFACMSTQLSRITIDPEICHGKPAIRHLRYPVVSLLEYLAAGDTFEDLLAEFPDLEREDLQACLEFAAESLKLKSQHLVLA